MGPLFRKKSALERKIEEIEKEAGRIKNTIKVLDRAVKKSDDATLRELAPAVRQEIRPSKPAPTPDTDDEIFGLQKQRPSLSPPPKPPSAPPPPRRLIKRAAPMDQKFASYLTSGSFVPATPLREDRSVQRNKAIFMVVIVAVVAFVLYSLFRHF